jgi:glycine/D-amino acid oxidase-like deaminating enzyme
MGRLPFGITIDMSARPLPKSLYAETARPPVDTPPLQGAKRVSVAVVGGGFTGLSAALHLAQGGAEVAVLEAHEPGWGASGRNGGQVNPGLKHDPATILRDFGPDRGGRMVRLSGAAPQGVFDLVREHQIQCEAHQGGTIRAAYHAAGLAEIRAGAEQNIAQGAPVEILDAEAMHRATGSTRYVGGAVDRRGGNVNPLGYARGLADAAQRAGAAIHGGSPVTQVAREAGGWAIATPEGRLQAEHLVLCTNGYTDNLWPGLRRSVVPVFSAVAATEPLPEDLARAIMPTRSVLYEIASVTVYYRLDAWNRLLMGGRSVLRDTSDPAEYTYRRLIRYSEQLWPALAGVNWGHFWNGQLAITPDHYPHLHEPAPGVIAALGYNGRGVAMATAMGRQIARRILTPDVPLDMPVTDLKPIAFHGLWRSAVAARVAYGRIRDMLGV